ncbi:hypothetical protein NDU88_005467 [Pleurodeles waltl]|uniref:Secreted protein n=1 Tax=Pleurodeles waltl TaxID=8319 RepID=A0AAV7TUX2_PLEWA|nr:hypothetical protein NDU88_005467 [Pleurodeles waltl]
MDYPGTLPGSNHRERNVKSSLCLHRVASCVLLFVVLQRQAKVADVVLIRECVLSSALWALLKKSVSHTFHHSYQAFSAARRKEYT